MAEDVKHALEGIYKDFGNTTIVIYQEDTNRIYKIWGVEFDQNLKVVKIVMDEVFNEY